MKKTGNIDQKLDLIVDKIQELEKRIESGITIDEREARQSSKKASEFRNKAEETKNKANEFLREISNISENVKEFYKGVENTLAKSVEQEKEIVNLSQNASENQKKMENRVERVNDYIISLESVFENHPDIDAERLKLEEILEISEDRFSKSDVLFKASLIKKKEIDQLYYEIIGYEDEDEDGKSYNVEGLKAKLEDTYSELEKGTENLRDDLRIIKEENIEELKNINSTHNENQIKQIDSWGKKYKKLEKEITNLLPNALTAGLSSAYSIKKENEESESKKLVIRFNIGIIGLVIVSIIPFLISFKSLSNGVNFEEIIFRLPRVVAAILPLYIPVLWLAYSANKKMNLSKRLIEEYTHKEVLSKTFEGLSKQVENLEDFDASSELRIKLLSNILEVSSENPGKLISDYNKSDHPLMDALEKSIKLSKAVSKLEAIPGLNKLSKLLDRKSKKIIREETEKVEDGLDTEEEPSA